MTFFTKVTFIWIYKHTQLHTKKTQSQKSCVTIWNASPIKTNKVLNFGTRKFL